MSKKKKWGRPKGIPHSEKTRKLISKRVREAYNKRVKVKGR